jgi:hypothetical protein
MKKLTEFKKVELLDWFDKEGYMPKIKKHGILYISLKFNLAIHLCACGCGIETVMPFYDGELNDNDGWKMTTKKIEGTTQSDRPYDFTVTFTPSIGNQKLSCKSHYFITDSKIQWL